MANASPSVIVHPGRHVTWYGDDTQRLRTVAILNALLGSWGRRGGFYNPEGLGLPKYPSPKYPKPKRSWRDAFPGQFKLADLALASGICDATIPAAGRDCSFKGWIVNGTNLIKTLPNQKNTLKAIQNLDLLVVNIVVNFDGVAGIRVGSSAPGCVSCSDEHQPSNYY